LEVQRAGQRDYYGRKAESARARQAGSEVSVKVTVTAYSIRRLVEAAGKAAVSADADGAEAEHPRIKECRWK